MTNEDIYQQYGLQSNPFRMHKTMDDIESFHVQFPLDTKIEHLLETVISKTEKKVILLTGPEGMGKTHRALCIAQQLQDQKRFCHLIRLQDTSRYAMSTFLQTMMPKGSVLLSNEKWQRIIAKLKKQVHKDDYDPSVVGTSLASVFNLHHPSFLIIDDLQRITDTVDVTKFLKSFETMFQQIKPGVCIIITIDPYGLSFLEDQHPSFIKQVSSTFTLPSVTNDLAEALISTRLSSKRMVSGLDMIFPFEKEAIQWMNTKAKCNPKKFLQLADIAFTAASYQKEIMITEEFSEDVYTIASDNGIDPLKEVKPKTSIQKPQQIKTMQDNTIKPDSIDSTLPPNMPTTDINEQDLALLNKMNSHITFQANTQIEKHIDTFLDHYTEHNTDMTEHSETKKHDDTHLLDKKRLDQIISMFSGEKSPLLTKGTLIQNDLSIDPHHSEMVLSDEINEILSTAASNKFVQSSTEKNENNGKKKKRFPLRLRKKTVNSTNKHPSASRVVQPPIKKKIAKQIPPKSSSTQKKKNKVLAKQIQKGKAKKQQQQIPSSISVKIVCPQCQKEFSTRIDSTKKEIICPHCTYKHHL